MKKTIRTILVSVFGMVLFAACSKPYDDTTLSGKVNDLENRVGDIERKLADLQNNVDAMSKLIKALQEEDRIKGLTKTDDGFIIEFTNSGLMEIKNGEKPAISVVLDEATGIWYWTVDGERVIVNGQSVPATMTPEIKVEDGKFWFRVNGGDWAVVAGSDSGVGLIKDIKDDDENVTIFLSDGDRTIVIPKVQSFRLNIDITEAGICANSSISVPYTIISGDSETKVVAFAGSGFTAEVNGNSVSGSIFISAPAAVPATANVLVTAVNGKGVSSSKILTMERGELKAAKDTYTIGAQGGELTVELETNLEYSVSKDPSPEFAWLTIVDGMKTRALRKESVTLNVAQYVGGTEPRTAVVQIIYGSGESKDITVTQLNVDVISGGRADFENFKTEPGRSTAAISDETTGGWKMTNGYLRKASVVTPNAKSKFPALYGDLQKIGTLTSPEIDGGCGIFKVELGGALLKEKVTNGLKVNVEIFQNGVVVKNFSLEVSPEDYEQKVSFERSQEVNLPGKFQIVIKNACLSGVSGSTGTTKDDVFVPSVSWIGYAE